MDDHPVADLRTDYGTKNAEPLRLGLFVPEATVGVLDVTDLLEDVTVRPRRGDFTRRGLAVNKILP
jgi:hypothetical protein